MPPEEQDPAFLWDMRQAAEEIAELILQTDESRFPEEKLVRFAVERLVLILGESADRVTDTYRGEHPEIPWRDLQRLRNLVAHNYGMKMAPELYRQCRQKLVPVSITLGGLVPKPPPGEETRKL